MKRPWLTTFRGQRTLMVLATLICLPLIPLAYNQISLEQERVPAPLDPADVFYCEVSACGQIEKLAGVEVVGVESTELEVFSTLVKVRFLNHPQLVGEREIWAVVRNEDGDRLEAARSNLVFSPKGELILELRFTSSLEELANTELYLGF